VTKSDLKMVRGLLTGDPLAKHRAMVLLEAAQAHSKRHAVKMRPARVVKAATKAKRHECDAGVRAAVFIRAAGTCELCKAFSSMDLHHLAPAAMRSRFNDETSTVAACRACHRLWHRGDVETLERSYQLAGAIGAHRLVLDGIRRKIDKITAASQHPGSTRP